MNSLLSEISKAKWIWTEQEGKNMFSGFLKTINLESVNGQSSMALTADMAYKLYINGTFVNSGPAPFRKPHVAVDVYDISSYLRKGENTLFILAYFAGIDLKFNFCDKPGMIAVAEINDQKGRALYHTDKSWISYPLEMWQQHEVRGNWALPNIEDVNTSHHSMKILSTYASEDYGTAGVLETGENLLSDSKTIAIDHGNIEFHERISPLSAWKKEKIENISKIYRTSTEQHPLEDNAIRLLNERKDPEYDNRIYRILKNGGAELYRNRGENGTCLLYDPRRIVAGDISIEFTCESSVTIDICYSDKLTGGFPDIYRTGFNYFCRVHGKPGYNKFRMFHYSGFRYVALVCKDYEGKLNVTKMNIHNKQADLDYDGSFHSNDQLWNEIFDISKRSIMLNSQESTHDCNSREKGTYWGDSMWIADMTGHLTGDFSYMKQLLFWAKRELPDNGFLMSNLHGLGEYLLDYCLVPPILLHRYVKSTGDISIVEAMLETCDKIISSFTALIDDSGLLSKEIFDRQSEKDGIIFLDHPGVHFHYANTTDIDRRDYSSGFNMFYLWAMDSRDKAAEMAGIPGRYENEIESLKSLCRKLYFHKKTGLVVDRISRDEVKAGALDVNRTKGFRAVDNSSLGYSQINNALAIITGLLDRTEGQAAMKKILNTNSFPWISMGTPYSFFYIFHAIELIQAPRLGVEAVKSYWKIMIEGGATTTWEGFRGEFHDSFNHAWSAGPVMLIYQSVLGLKPLTPGYGTFELHPALDLFDSFDSSFFIPQGIIKVKWERLDQNSYNIKISTPEATQCTLINSNENMLLEAGEITLVLKLNKG